MFEINKHYKVRSGKAVAFDVLGYRHLYNVGTVLKYLGPTNIKPDDYHKDQKYYTFHVFFMSDDNGYSFRINPLIFPVIKQMVKEKDTKDQKFDPYDNGPYMMFEAVTTLP
jgi:hypothetical protein